MFRKLKLRLTLINVTVMGFLLLLFITATYFVMQAQIFNQSQQLMQMIARDAGSGQARSLNEHSRRTMQYFSVKTDVSGNIIDSSSDLPLQRNQLSLQVQKIITSKKPKGEVEWQGQAYTYLSVPLEAENGFIVVFTNLERERDVLNFLLLALLIAGLVSLFLAFYASWFLANKALIPIRESWQRQKDFVADASHELRTPLAVIQTNLEVVQGNSNDSVESQLNWLDNIEIETKQMVNLVDNLLFLARADSQQQLLEVKSFCLSDAINEALKPFKVVAAAQNVILIENVDPDILFLGDENRIKQLIVIFLDNSLKYTPPGGQITVNVQNLGKEVAISVIDTGEGIEHEHLHKIFERFYRVDKSRSRNEGGSGLGLSIAEWIVKNYDGNIQVSSTPSQGTTFSITLQKTKTQ